MKHCPTSSYKTVLHACKARAYVVRDFQDKTKSEEKRNMKENLPTDLKRTKGLEIFKPTKEKQYSFKETTRGVYPPRDYYVEKTNQSQRRKA